MTDKSDQITEITESPFGSQFGNWLKGNHGKYHFEAKVFDTGSHYGIDGGRVSKLMIWDVEIRQQTGNLMKACIVNYDRGWDIKPEKAQDKQVLKTVLKRLNGYKKSLLSTVEEKKKEADALNTAAVKPPKKRQQEI